MDGRGGCCIARYAGGVYDASSKVDRIMLRFRPIAPKPASVDGFAPPGAAVVPASNQRPFARQSPGRKKRRNSKEGESESKGNKRCGGRKKKTSSEVVALGGSGVTAVKTLPLLPEAPDGLKESVGKVVDGSFPLWLRTVNHGSSVGGGSPPVAKMEDAAADAALGRRTVAASWVKVERVTSDSWVLDVGLGGTDEEKLMSLDLDECPGFVSDILNGVRWTNPAYRRMVAGEEVAVRVVLEEGVALPVQGAAFTCRVRVVTCGKEKSSMTLPCDVWRMDCGGFAWRLDTKAALSLGW